MIYKSIIKLSDGVFTITHSEKWQPMGSLGVFKRADGTLSCMFSRPMGTLIKYPCGTKRFIPEHTAPDLKTLFEMI